MTTICVTSVNQIVDAAEPDAIINCVIETMPGIIPKNVRASGFYAYTSQVCELARNNQVQKLEEKITSLMSACLTQGKSLDDPKILDLLQARSWQPGLL